MMKDWVFKVIGKFVGVYLWNCSMKRGFPIFQRMVTAGMSIAEILFWPHIFFHALSLLFKEKIERVIDTQPLGTIAIIKAIRIYNKFTKRSVVLEKVLADLPTEYSTHFYQGIKRLSEKDKKVFKLITIKPLMIKQDSEEEFWKKTCNLSLDNVQYEKFFIRKSFESFANRERKREDYYCFIKTGSASESLVSQRIFSRGKVDFKICNESFEFKIGPEDKLITIVLGSQPSLKATFNYVKGFIDLAKGWKERVYLFAYCSKFSEGLFDRIANYCALEKDYPDNLIIIPMSFQGEETIASLFFRSDLTITRSAGQTIMELLAVCKGTKFIHVEAKNSSIKALFKSMPKWEAGLALYLKEKLNCPLVNPLTFHNFVDQCSIR